LSNTNEQCASARNFLPRCCYCLLLSAGAGLHAAETTVATRYGPVSVLPASEERSALLFKGQPVGRMKGDASLRKLAIHSDNDYVLADAESPGLHCRHEFVLMEIGAGRAPAVSAPFGECMTLFGARLQDGKAVVQLADAVRADPAATSVHEFAFADGRVEALPKVLGACEASALSAASIGVPLTPDEAGKTVGGSGRAYFHTAPLEECRTPKVFLVPGDRSAPAARRTPSSRSPTAIRGAGRYFAGGSGGTVLFDPAQ
jgi:hypothetical protein